MQIYFCSKIIVLICLWQVKESCYSLSSVCGCVCLDTPWSFTDQWAPNLAWCQGDVSRSLWCQENVSRSHRQSRPPLWYGQLIPALWRANLCCVQLERGIFYARVPEGVSKINQSQECEETPGRGVITFQAIENSTSQPLLQTEISAYSDLCKSDSKSLNLIYML